ncbi:MAG: acetyl-CoA carboxylase biotin carboxyl carrier protein [Acidobacteria bacterium]|nr:acetyl-CoA carboxylase biotin carboxyl carrier protein [Acidobacteriota bacterium]
MTFEQIKALIDIVCQKGLQELEVERSDFRVKIVGPSVGVPAAFSPAVQQASTAAAVAGAHQTTAAAPETASEGKAGHVITSPIVGTFYHAPSPDADPYARVGDRVSVGQVLCIVEAMKLMNEIESDVAGEVLEILPSNGQPVEFGEPLFVIRVDS